MNPTFHLPTFLFRIEEAATQQQLLALLKELEKHCTTMALEECQGLSWQVAERMSNRIIQHTLYTLLTQSTSATVSIN